MEKMQHDYTSITQSITHSAPKRPLSPVSLVAKSPFEGALCKIFSPQNEHTNIWQQMATNPSTEDVAKVQSNKSLGLWNCKVETMWKWCRASLRQLRQDVACVSGYSCHFSHESAWEALKFFGSNRLAAIPAEPAGRQRRKHRPVQTKAPYPTNRTSCGMKADQVIEIMAHDMP